MKASQHAAAAVPVSLGIWALTGNVWYFFMSFFLGFLVDVDHVVDYIREERRFDFKHMFKKSYEGDFKKLWLIFHAYEYVIIAWIAGFLTGNLEFAAVFTAAYLVHMVPDQTANNVHPLGYFITYRMIKKFDMWEIFHYNRSKVKTRILKKYNKKI
ncbi:MAG: hypothetical protein ACLFP1_05560 [Candidatus Goldiibacteriota bacterium]